MTAPPPSRDLPRITLAVLFIGLMIVASLWILRPFIAATVWAATGAEIGPYRKSRLKGD